MSDGRWRANARLAHDPVVSSPVDQTGRIRCPPRRRYPHQQFLRQEPARLRSEHLIPDVSKTVSLTHLPPGRTRLRHLQRMPRPHPQTGQGLHPRLHRRQRPVLPALPAPAELGRPVLLRQGVRQVRPHRSGPDQSRGVCQRRVVGDEGQRRGVPDGRVQEGYDLFARGHPQPHEPR